jgi:sugar/nucleoside kinase (ribokinase family)
VHISIMDWARHALADAVAAGRSTSTDLHDWDGRDDYHQDFAYQADIVFVSTASLGDRVADTLHDILDWGRASVAVAMAGGDGSYLKSPNQPLRQVPAVPLPPDQVLDTNGAGDSYVAGFLYAHLAGRDWPACARAGAIAGAHACRSAGTHTSFVSADQLDAAPEA